MTIRRCPHCQAYKPHYVELAYEMKRRAISQDIYFHAVSCTLNADVCYFYGIDGYPAVMGWKGDGGLDESEYSNTLYMGMMLNEDDGFSADSIAEDMGFEIAQEEKVDGVGDSEDGEEFSNSQDKREFEEWKAERGTSVATEKHESFEYDHDINERFHNAAVSLAYILKTGVYTSRKKLSHSQESALSEFLTLVEWATPSTWSVRSAMVTDLVYHFDEIIKSGKKALVEMVKKHQSQSYKKGRRREELLWGHIDERKSRRVKSRQIVKGALGAEHGSHQIDTDSKMMLKENSAWTAACTHDKPYGGFTCGLWELFHILTIGATKRQNQLYGFSHGNLVSSKDVAGILSNFISNFFRCDVCKNNFIAMYDNCGFNHCQRLGGDIPFLREGTLGADGVLEDRSETSMMELVVWLWEVHNAGK